MLGLSQARIPLIESSQIWSQILVIITNSKLGILVCSHPTVDLTSQCNFYDDLILYHTSICSELHLL